MSGRRCRENGDRQIHLLGGTPYARFTEVSLALPEPFSAMTWTAEVGFLHDADLNLSFAGVLGQAGFLDRWVVAFNYVDGYFVVEEHGSFTARLAQLGIDPYEEFQRLDADWHPPAAF